MNSRNDFNLWQRPSLQILSDRQLDAVYTAAMDILERVGGDFHDAATVELLASAGAHVDSAPRVRIPGHLVEAAVASAPRRITVYDRRGRCAMHLEKRNAYFGCGSDTPYVIDHTDDSHRLAVKADVARAARLVDHLAEIDFCMSFGLASDVNRMTSDCHHFEVMVANTRKPLVLVCWDLQGLTVVYEMMTAVKGDAAALAAEPFVVVFLMSISPLVFPAEALQKLHFCAQRRIPVVWTSGCPTMGSTAPIHPAGALAVATAEFLSGLVVAQLVRKHTPVVLGGAFGSMDMSTALRPYAAPEQDFGHICQGEMGRHLGIPSWGCGGATEANLLDEQAASEAHQKLFAAAMGGNNLIHDLGYMQSGLCSSLELLTMCNEFAGRTRRFLKGIPVSQETLATDSILQTGPGGNFLTHDDTAAHCREAVWMPELIDRHDYSAWKAAGASTLRQRTNARVREILATHAPEPLPAEVSRFLRETVAAYDRRRPDGR